MTKSTISWYLGLMITLQRHVTRKLYNIYIQPSVDCVLATQLRVITKQYSLCTMEHHTLKIHDNNRAQVSAYSHWNNGTINIITAAQSNYRKVLFAMQQTNNTVYVVCNQYVSCKNVMIILPLSHSAILPCYLCPKQTNNLPAYNLEFPQSLVKVH